MSDNPQRAPYPQKFTVHDLEVLGEIDIPSGSITPEQCGFPSQKVYYVSAELGDDTDGDGSVINPFATVGKAYDTGAAEYDYFSVCIDFGDYSSETITIASGKGMSLTTWGGPYQLEGASPSFTANGYLSLDNGLSFAGTIDGTGEVYIEESLLLGVNFGTNFSSLYLLGSILSFGTPPSGWDGFYYDADNQRFVVAAGIKSNGKITDVTDPTEAQDAATKNYVDSQMSSALPVYRQAAEPTLAADDDSAIWVDTNDSNRTYLVFRESAGNQLKVELS